MPFKVRWTHFRMSLRAGMRQLREGWMIYRRNRLAMLGLFLLLIYTIMAVSHPILMKTVWVRTIYDPSTGFDPKIFPHPTPPSSAHLLGTDALGRDVLSMLLAASAPTIVLAIVAALTTAVIGTLVGAFSAYWRGGVDMVFSHLSDVMLLAPAPLVLVVLSGIREIPPPEFGLIYGLIGGLGGAAIIMRSYALKIVARPFIDASRVAGASHWRIIFRHMIPHMLPLAAVQMMLTVTGAVFADGFSAFMGISRARLNWGSMIYSSFTMTRVAVSTDITWNVLLPAALAISFFAAAFYMIARGLQEVNEPRLRSR